MNQQTYEEKLEEMETNHRMALSRISHEIRNPVALMNGFLQLIESQHPEVSTFQHWDQVMSNMDFLKELLDEISTYHKSTAITKTTTNLYLFVEMFVWNLSLPLSRENISLQVVKETAIPVLSLDQVKIKEVLHNLVRNSAEAIGQNGTITITLSSDGSFVYLVLSDDGPGIPATYLDTLFDPFVSHKKDGTGLGLAIVKNIVSAHGGTISVASKESMGTTFTISLPV